MLQYSPESFGMTEVEFAKEISEAVMECGSRRRNAK